MPVITRITPQKKRENRHNIFLDGRFTFGCSTSVVARFSLRVGLDISHEQVREIEFGEIKHECFDNAVQLLSQRMHSKSELYKKLRRREWGDGVVEAVIEDLTHMGYVDDERFALAHAESAVKHKQHGRRRAFLELIRCGVTGDIAEKALTQVYAHTSQAAVARDLAMKHAPRLRSLAPPVARRRLVGLLQRRGFNFQDTRAAVEEALGKNEEDAEL